MYTIFTLVVINFTQELSWWRKQRYSNPFPSKTEHVLIWWGEAPRCMEGSRLSSCSPWGLTLETAITAAGTPCCSQSGKKGKSSLQYITLGPKGSGVEIVIDQPLSSSNSWFELNITGNAVVGTTWTNGEQAWSSARAAVTQPELSFGFCSGWPNNST